MEEVNTKIAYRCKKCRALVATRESILEHEPAALQDSAKSRPKSLTTRSREKRHRSLWSPASPVSAAGSTAAGESHSPATAVAVVAVEPCHSVFVDPELSLLHRVDLDGKLECVNARCRSKLGNFSWMGLACSCGAWICPGFALNKSRVDLCREPIATTLALPPQHPLYASQSSPGDFCSIDFDFMISISEREFLRGAVDADCRLDGRQRVDMRPYAVETGILPQANGSARVRLAFQDPSGNGADVLVGVKCEVTTPRTDRPAEGRLECHVDWLAGVGGTSGGALVGGTMDREEEAALANGIVQLLEKTLLLEGVLDYAQLCIVPKQICWLLHVDVEILNLGGNLVDVVFMAVRAALFNTRLPNVVPSSGSDGGDVDGSRSAVVDYELLADEQEMLRLDVSKVPLCITMHKISDRHVVDASLEEEACSEARLHCAVDAQGHLLLVQKSGRESIAPAMMTNMLQTAKRIATTLLQQHHQVLLLDESRQNNKILR